VIGREAGEVVAQQVEAFLHGEAMVEEHRLFGNGESGREHGEVPLRADVIECVGQAPR